MTPPLPEVPPLDIDAIVSDRAEDVLAGMLALQRLRGRLSKVTVSDVRTLLAAIPQPRVRAEPPDSGDGAARLRAIEKYAGDLLRERDSGELFGRTVDLLQAALNGNTEAIEAAAEPRDAGIDATLLAKAVRWVLGDTDVSVVYDARWREYGERIAAEYARLRSGSPAPAKWNPELDTDG